MFSASVRSGSEFIRQQRWRAAQVFVIVLFGAVIYSNTFDVPFVMDDFNLSGFDRAGFGDILFHGGARRVADLTFAVNFKLHGLRLEGFHFVNLVIHLMASAVLYFTVHLVLNAMGASAASGKESDLSARFVPFAAALLFVCHPVQTQAVTYIIQRYASLATLFYLTSVLAFLKCRLVIEENGARMGVAFWSAAAIVSGVLAIGCKQIAFTLPLMLFLIELIVFNGRLTGRRFRIICATVLVAVLLAGVAKWHDSSWREFLYDVNRSTSEDATIFRSTYLLTQIRVVAVYLGLLCLPVGQNLLHTITASNTLFSWKVMPPLVLHLSIMLSAAVLYRMSRTASGRHHVQGALQRLASVGIVWFYVTMAVESSIFPIRDMIFEHRIYLPSAGFFMTMSAFAGLLALQWRHAALSVIVLVCIAAGGMTFVRNAVWRSPMALWQDTLSKSPDNGFAMANLAGVYLSQGMPEKSLPLFINAILKNAQFQAFSLGEALLRLNVDRSRFTTGREYIFPPGMPPRERVDRLDLMKYEATIRNNLALAYEYLGEFDKARQCYMRALAICPEFDLAWYNLGLLALRKGEKQLADDALLRLRERNSPLTERLHGNMPQ